MKHLQVEAVEADVDRTFCRFPALEHYRGFTVPDTDEFAVYHKWLQATSALPSVQSAMPSEKEVTDFYSKYAKRDATWREP